MNTRNLTVRYSTEGFAGAINSLKQVGQAFDSALAQSQQAAANAANAARNAVNPEEIAKANKEIERSVVQGNQIISNSYKALGVKQEADVRRQKESAIAAFNAIKNSGVASANDIARAEVALNRRLQELDRSLETVETQAKQTGGGFTVLKGAIANLASSAIIGGIQSITGAVKNLIGNVIEAGTTAERQAVSFETFLGSQEKAAKVLADIREFAATTQFQLPEVTDAGKQLLAAGFGAEELIPTLKMVAEVATAADKPLSQVLFIYAQIKNQGKAMAGDINQLYNAGLGAKDFAKALNISEEAVKSLASKGEIGFKEVKKVFESLTSEGGRFYGLIDKLSDTTGTKLSNLEDAFGEIYRTIYAQIEPAISSVLDVIVETIAPLGESKELWAGVGDQALEFKRYIEQNPEIVKELSDQLKDGVAVAMKGIATTAKQFLGYLKENPNAIASAVDTMGFLVKALEKSLGLVNKILEGYRAIALITGEGGAYQEGARQSAEDAGVNRAEFDRRVRAKIDAVPKWKIADRDAIVEEVLNEVLDQKREVDSYGPPVPKDVLKVPAKAVANTSGSLPANVLPHPPASSAPSEPKAKKELTPEQQFAAKTIAIAKELKIDPQALMNIMLFESAGTLSPKIRGPVVGDDPNNRGRGLIQFMPGTARGLGTSDAALAGMTQLQQLDWVKKYFAQFKGNFGAGKLENLYAAVLAGNPQKVNASDGYTTAREGAKRMQREYGKKASSLLGNVPQGADLSDQYEYDTSLEDAQRDREQELRRQEEKRRQDTRERREQQQKLELAAYQDKNANWLREFDQYTNTLPETEQPAREFLRSEKEREIELAEKLLGIEQQIRNLEIERAEKVADLKAGYEVDPKDLTAEIQALEREKESANRTFESSKSQGRSEFAKVNDSQSELDSALKLKGEVGGYFLDEEAIALSAVEEKYQGYKESIDEAIASLETLINNKKMLGQSTAEEEKAIAQLQEQKSLIPQYQKAESKDIKRDFRLEREGEKLDVEGQLIDKDAQISGQKANFLDRIGFTFAANGLKRKSAIAIEQNRYQKELLELEKQFKDDPTSTALSELKEKAEELNRVNLEAINSEFKTVGQTIKDLGIDAVKGFVQNLATNFFDSRGDRDKALMEERLRYAEELVQLEGQFKEEPGHLAHLKNRARELNEEKLDKIKGEFNGFKRVIGMAGQALLEFTKQLAAMAAQYAAAKVISSIFKSAAFSDGGTVQNASEGITVGHFDNGGGIQGRKVSDRLTNWMRGNFSGVAKAWNAEGEGAQLGVFHVGEELLSRKTGEAGRYQALKARYGFNPLEKIQFFADGGTIGDNLLSSIGSTRPRIDLSGLQSGSRGQKAIANKNVTINTTVVTPNADSFRLNQDQLNQDLMERMRRGI